MKEIKLRRKEEERLQRAEVHAAISLAGVAAALSAIADETSKESTSPKEAAVASAAALVATQCAKVAEAMGAKREQLEDVIGSAMSSTNASDIITLTAAAKTCNYIYIYSSLLNNEFCIFRILSLEYKSQGVDILKLRLSDNY